MAKVPHSTLGGPGVANRGDDRATTSQQGRSGDPAEEDDPVAEESGRACSRLVIRTSSSSSS